MTITRGCREANGVQRCPSGLQDDRRVADHILFRIAATSPCACQHPVEAAQKGDMFGDLALLRHAQDVAVDVEGGEEDPLLSGDAVGSGSDFSGWTAPGALPRWLGPYQCMHPVPSFAVSEHPVKWVNKHELLAGPRLRQLQAYFEEAKCLAGVQAVLETYSLHAQDRR